MRPGAGVRGRLQGRCLQGHLQGKGRDQCGVHRFLPVQLQLVVRHLVPWTVREGTFAGRRRCRRSRGRRRRGCGWQHRCRARRTWGRRGVRSRNRIARRERWGLPDRRIAFHLRAEGVGRRCGVRLDGCCAAEALFTRGQATGWTRDGSSSGTIWNAALTLPSGHPSTRLHGCRRGRRWRFESGVQGGEQGKKPRAVGSIPSHCTSHARPSCLCAAATCRSPKLRRSRDP